MSDERCCDTCCFGSFAKLSRDGSCQMQLTPQWLNREYHVNHPARQVRPEYGTACKSWSGKDGKTRPA